MSTTSTGLAAETAAANYLIAEGFTVLARNWKTRYCEIDIVATSGNIIYFVEVKHRTSDMWGDGLAYITPKKQAQMKFAAEMYLMSKPLHDAVLAAIAVSGNEYIVSHFIVLDD